jgi:hypothetical protein
MMGASSALHIQMPKVMKRPGPRAVSERHRRSTGAGCRGSQDAPFVVCLRAFSSITSKVVPKSLLRSVPVGAAK